MRTIIVAFALLALLGAATARGSHSYKNHESYHDADADEHVANAEATGTRPKCGGNSVCGSKGDFDTYLFSQWWPSTNCANENCDREYVFRTFITSKSLNFSKHTIPDRGS
jgi:hypothetical protein